MLRDLDQQQQMLIAQVTAEKEKLEDERQRLTTLFKQKKLETNLPSTAK